MEKYSALKDKVILAVDDEPDVLSVIEETLDMCIIKKAGDFDTATQYLLNYNYDIVILDIMGVDGFKLLKTSVSLGFPTVMFTAHALEPDALKKSIKLGAVSFLPKEKISEFPEFLEDVVLRKGEPLWRKLFQRFESFFAKRFGPDWKEKDRFFKYFENELKKSEAEKIKKA